MSQDELFPVEKRKRGRPKLPELERLNALLNTDFQPSSWPLPISDSPCWQQRPPMVWMNGRPTTPLRAFFENMLGQPLHRAWRLKRICPGYGCVNPHHHRVSVSFRVDALSPPLPPTWLLVAEARAAIAEQPQEIGVDECVDLITDASGHDLSLPDLQLKLRGYAEPEVIEQAYARLHPSPHEEPDMNK